MSRTLDQFSVDMERISAGDFRAAVLKEMKGLKFRVEAKAKLNATTGPRVRSNRLRSSIKAEVLEGTNEVGLRLGAGTKYARVQELGGTITPKTSKYLAIPVGNTRTATGDTKAEFAGGFRSVTGIFSFKSKNGKLLLGRRTSTGLEVLAVLVPSVTLFGWRYLTRAIESEVDGFKTRLQTRIKALIETGQAPT